MNGSAMRDLYHTLRLSSVKSGRQLIICLALLGFALVAPRSQAQVDGPTKALMHTFVVELVKMNPYLSSDTAFQSEKGKEVVGGSLKTLAGKVKNAPESIGQAPGFRINFGILADHINRTQQAFDRGEMQYARVRVNGIGNLCAACHMQAPQISNFSAFEFVKERSKDIIFDNANFLFVIRRYDEALAQFDQLLRNYPKSAIKMDQLNDAFLRKLGILARVYRNPKMAKESLMKDLANENLPPEIRTSLKEWIASLSKWQEEKVDPASLKTPELLAYVNKNMSNNLNRKIPAGDPRLLTLLRLSGLLYERLYKEPDSPQAQEILYDLAQCERSLAPQYWYSVSEVYLKECVKQYPKKPFTKKCFEAYQNGMEERYLGGRMPEGVRQSIEALKEYL